MFVQKSPWRSRSIEDIDQAVWNAICHWYLHAEVDIIRNGLDYSELTRSLLWDKTSRAIRKTINPDSFAFEQKLLELAKRSRPDENRSPLVEAIKQPMRPLYDRGRAIKQRIRSQTQSVPILFVPRPCTRMNASLRTFARSQNVVLALAYLESTQVLRSNQLGISPRLSQSDFEYGVQLYAGILQGLKHFDITLLDEDVRLLHRQIMQQLAYLKVVETEMAMTRPKAIFTYADNHHPVQEYILVARREGIPSIVLQHGLDCERNYLDEAYASVIAVWGKARLQRYQQESSWQPEQIQITGNPEYDRLRLPETLNLDGKYWLWVTRPHSPVKCYTPSRFPNEGIKILEALLNILKRSPSERLVIKPHPNDYADIYQEYIDRYQLADQVEVTTTAVQTLIPDASIVLSEDSTAGLEAMFFGKVVVHTHFAPSKPVMPFVQCGAALPAYTPDMLQESLERAQQLTRTEQKSLLEAQRSFLTDYAGTCDGNACDRVLSLILDVVR